MLFSFETTFGDGVDPWYDKAERWAKKKFKNPFVQHLALGLIEWLKGKWPTSIGTSMVSGGDASGLQEDEGN